ncbi:MAG: carboxypeptidase-like regulatory domain-containing protein [Nitrosopumilus sp.]
MITTFSIIMLLLSINVTGFLFVSSAYAAENNNSMILSINSLSVFEQGKYPFVNGIVTDSNGNPLSDVEIQANFSSDMGIATTDSAGEFSITSNIPAEELGEHTVTVYATKDTMYLNTHVTYDIMTQSEIAKINADSREKTPNTSSYDNSKYDLLSRTILEDMEEQKKENIKNKILSGEQNEMSEQRLETNSKLEKELKSFEEKNESHTPRNAFLRFLADIDYSVKDIFWHQFLFTEERTDDAREAKEYALEEGKSSLEATKIFQQEAAISQNEIIEYNKELNIKYGNATSGVQEQFDENGKLPRED